MAGTNVRPHRPGARLRIRGKRDAEEVPHKARERKDRVGAHPEALPTIERGCFT